jgi:hypothetical protein
MNSYNVRMNSRGQGRQRRPRMIRIRALIKIFCSSMRGFGCALHII